MIEYIAQYERMRIMDKTEENTIGMQMARIRKEHHCSQEEVARRWPSPGGNGNGIDRTVYSKYETGKLIPSDEKIAEFASIFNISTDELRNMYHSTAIVIPDTSALLNNILLLEWLMEDFYQIVLTSTVQLELSGMKNAKGDLTKEQRINKKKASQIIGMINEIFDQQNAKLEKNPKYKCKIRKEDSESIELSDDSGISINDRKLISLAQKLAKKSLRKVYIIHNDKDIPFFSDSTISIIKMKDYMTKRKSKLIGYQYVVDFDEEFDNFIAYEKIFDELDKETINALLPNGMTLLISCINCNTPDNIERRGRVIPASIIKKKILFLIKHGVDLDKTDYNRYCHTPLEHCISLNKECGYSFELFKMLIEAGADYNKGSVDETKERDLRISEKNEGNTPLMKACWEGKKKFVLELLSKPDISINQQDCNGYTALIKCAVKRYDNKKKGFKYKIYEELYRLLIEKGADTRIRDRNNKTAEDWWNKGNSLNNEGVLK